MASQIAYPFAPSRQAQKVPTIHYAMDKLSFEAVCDSIITYGPLDQLIQLSLSAYIARPEARAHRRLVVELRNHLNKQNVNLDKGLKTLDMRIAFCKDDGLIELMKVLQRLRHRIVELRRKPDGEWKSGTTLRYLMLTEIDPRVLANRPATTGRVALVATCPVVARVAIVD